MIFFPHFIDVLDDEDELTLVLLIVCQEYGIPEEEMYEWLSNIAHIQEIQTVGEIKKTIKSSQWREIPLPEHVKDKIVEVLENPEGKSANHDAISSNGKDAVEDIDKIMRELNEEYSDGDLDEMIELLDKQGYPVDEEDFEALDFGDFVDLREYDDDDGAGNDDYYDDDNEPDEEIEFEPDTKEPQLELYEKEEQEIPKPQIIEKKEETPQRKIFTKEEEKEREAKRKFYRRDRHASTISPIVQAILDKQNEDLDLEEDGLGDGMLFIF